MTWRWYNWVSIPIVFILLIALMPVSLDTMGGLVRRSRSSGGSPIPVDVDGNGILDSFEQPMCEVKPQKYDSDGDGVMDTSETEWGLDPNDPYDCAGAKDAATGVNWIQAWIDLWAGRNSSFHGDRDYETNYLLDAGDLTKASKILAWDEAYILGSLVDMYRVTGSTAFSRKFRQHTDRLMNLSSSLSALMTDDLTKFQGWYVLPIVEFSFEVLSRGTRANINDTEAAVGYIDAVESNVIPCWERHVSMYYNDGKPYGSFSDFPWNYQLTMAEVYLYLWHIYTMMDGRTVCGHNFTGDAVGLYWERSAMVGNLFKERLSIDRTHDSYRWHYLLDSTEVDGWSYQRTENNHAKSLVEDVCHGNDMIFAIDAWRFGLRSNPDGRILFNDTDMLRFVNTYTRAIWGGDIRNPFNFASVDGRYMTENGAPWDLNASIWNYVLLAYPEGAIRNSNYCIRISEAMAMSHPTPDRIGLLRISRIVRALMLAKPY